MRHDAGLNTDRLKEVDITLPNCFTNLGNLGKITCGIFDVTLALCAAVMFFLPTTGLRGYETDLNTEATLNFPISIFLFLLCASFSSF